MVNLYVLATRYYSFVQTVSSNPCSKTNGAQLGRKLPGMVDKPPNDLDQLVGSLTPGVEDEEPVALPREERELDRLPHGREPSGIVRDAVVQHVLVGVHDERRREGDVVQRHAVRPERARRRVVPGGAGGQREAPQLVEQGGAHEPVQPGRLGRRPVLAGEEGPEHDAAREAEREPSGGDDHVVRDVGAGRVAGDEHPGEVGGPGGEPRVGRGPVVGGQHERRELGGEAEPRGVEVGQLVAAQAEAAAVEVHEHRQRLADGGRGPVHAEPERVRGVVDDVLPLDGQVGRHVAVERESGVVRGARHGAVAEQLHDAEAVLYDVRRRGWNGRCRRGRRRRHTTRIRPQRLMGVTTATSSPRGRGPAGRR
ncbi:hypothetical protein BS78_02G146000 [Paspalum vaginatum]|nr:hypothetical protein BS78_02G146000 [Paspalum vaginatum]